MTRRLPGTSLAACALLLLTSACNLESFGQVAFGERDPGSESATDFRYSSDNQRSTPQHADSENVAVRERGTSDIVPLPGAPTSFAELVNAAKAGVVGIYTTQRVANGYVQRGPYGYEPRVQQQQGLGSGFVVDGQGYILTNSHVVVDADEVRIRTHDDRSFAATIVGVDPLTDLAVLKVEPYDGMRPLRLGDSDSVAVGDWLLAVGNPFGLSFSVTAGILSARGRRDVPLNGPIRYVDFLQTDASINPGNSGGPIINMQGDVIGIATAVNRAGQGIGFAIPSNMAHTIYESLRGGGSVERSWMGVRIGEVPKKTSLGDSDGALVTAVAQGGPADRAGIVPGDVIVAFAGQEIGESAELPWLASTAGVGEAIDVDILREGQRHTIRLTLGEMPN